MTHVIAEVLGPPAASDPDLAQIPHSHFVRANVPHRWGSLDQRGFFFAKVLLNSRLPPRHGLL